MWPFLSPPHRTVLVSQDPAHLHALERKERLENQDPPLLPLPARLHMEVPAGWGHPGLLGWAPPQLLPASGPDFAPVHGEIPSSLEPLGELSNC